MAVSWAETGGNRKQITDRIFLRGFWADLAVIGQPGGRPLAQLVSDLVPGPSESHPGPPGEDIQGTLGMVWL